MKCLTFVSCLLLVSHVSRSQTDWSAQSGSINYMGGKVGIGTTSPQVKLHIADDANAPGITLGVNSITGGYTALRTELSTVSGGYASLQSIKSSGSYWGDLVLNLSGGNVGIGTNTPQAKLAVNGDILSKKVKVTQIGWADYVFQPTYRLRPLNEVEQYINQYHHLPEVISAEEVQKNGVDLGDNQATLLKKIEELTLYVIEQNKKLEEQNKRLQAQSQKQQELEERVNEMQQENGRLMKQLSTIGQKK